MGGLWDAAGLLLKEREWGVDAEVSKGGPETAESFEIGNGLKTK